ncbi:MAG: hypothetical protein WCV93_00390 [Candidatus Shapirobacteria bacterium]|jgi:hypothetical protein
MARDTFVLNIDLESGGRSSAQISEYPDKCPTCHEGGQPKFVLAHSLGAAWDYDEVIEAIFKCPINKCKRYYIGYYYKPSRTGDIFFLKETLAPQFWKPIYFSDEIKNISSRFERIYNQAAIAENFGLDEIAGGGYRKSLEFLVKDYLIYLKLKTKTQIAELKLSKAVALINDNRIQVCAKRAAWLGNDEIHFNRVWENKDIQNLKELIKLSTNLMESDVIAKKYEKEMPEKKKN